MINIEDLCIGKYLIWSAKNTYIYENYYYHQDKSIGKITNISDDKNIINVLWNDGIEAKFTPQELKSWTTLYP